jgi:hypothetical protein
MRRGCNRCASCLNHHRRKRWRRSGWGSRKGLLSPRRGFPASAVPGPSSTAPGKVNRGTWTCRCRMRQSLPLAGHAARPPARVRGPVPGLGARVGHRSLQSPLRPKASLQRNRVRDKIVADMHRKHGAVSCKVLTPQRKTRNQGREIHDSPTTPNKTNEISVFFFFFFQYSFFFFHQHEFVLAYKTCPNSFTSAIRRAYLVIFYVSL